LTATDELYRDSLVSDRTWATLSTHFDAVTIVNALISAAQYRQVSVALNTFGVPGEPGDEPLPSRMLRARTGPRVLWDARAMSFNLCPAVSGRNSVARMAHDWARQAMITMPEDSGM
jgi:hypothetical protein